MKITKYTNDDFNNRWVYALHTWDIHMATSINHL